MLRFDQKHQQRRVKKCETTGARLMGGVATGHVASYAAFRGWREKSLIHGILYDHGPELHKYMKLSLKNKKDAKCMIQCQIEDMINISASIILEKVLSSGKTGLTAR